MVIDSNVIFYTVFKYKELYDVILLMLCDIVYWSLYLKKGLSLSRINTLVTVDPVHISISLTLLNISANLTVLLCFATDELNYSSRFLKVHFEVISKPLN